MSSACVHLASDLHLGASQGVDGKDRERAFVTWMRDAARGEGFAQGKGATELHLVGDVFDFWFEYKHAVPKGGARLMGAIAELTDEGLEVHFHAGNHDMWTFGYLEDELGWPFTASPLFAPTTAQPASWAWRWFGPWGFRISRAEAHVHFQALPSGVQVHHLTSASPRLNLVGAKPESKANGPWGQRKNICYMFAGNGSRHRQPDVDLFIFGHRHQPIDAAVEGHHALPQHRRLDCPQNVSGHSKRQSRT